MVLAMMLPTAAPMLSTYATLADTAVKRSEPVISVWVLAAGYLVVWLAFSVVASIAQIGLSLAGTLTAFGAPATMLLSGGVLLAAGIYQFTPAKLACLTKCQNPFLYFFSNWTTDRIGIFRLGLAQGLYCLGCCWALMAVKFAVGVMNLVWVAFLCALMVIEKNCRKPLDVQSDRAIPVCSRSHSAGPGYHERFSDLRRTDNQFGAARNNNWRCFPCRIHRGR